VAERHAYIRRLVIHVNVIVERLLGLQKIAAVLGGAAATPASALASTARKTVRIIIEYLFPLELKGLNKVLNRAPS